MRDLVLDGFVKKFAESRGISGRPAHEVFEAFAASSVLRKYHQADITEVEDGMFVGGGGDGGIDAVMILVNGRPAMTKEAVDFFIEKLHRLDVEFVFVQAKNAPRFSARDIGSFGFGVEQFLAAVMGHEPKLEFNTEVHQTIDLAHYIIYEQNVQMMENPTCVLYYVTAGQWNNAKDLKGRIEYIRNQITQTNIFLDVGVTPVDAPLLKSIYRGLERGVVGEVEFSKAAVFPKIEGVDDAYIGLLPGTEFIKLVSTEEGELNSHLFYDNVRDYQGNNPVNREINQTLVEDQRRSSFPLLNNGVTIVARSINRIGDTFRIFDFQIVNGCQTSHILFHNKVNVGADTFIPVKLVATNDSQVVADVIKATNNQTAVLPEALATLTVFHKELEDYYSIQEQRVDSAIRIYYERRSKQYTLEKIAPGNIVTLTRQIKSFVGMFLDEPQSHPRYYGELLKSYEGRIFADHHKPDAYYASGVALLVVEKWLNSRTGDSDLRAYKYQLLMLLRILISGHDVPPLNSQAISGYSMKIVDVLRRSEEGREHFKKAISVLRSSLSKFGKERPRMSTAPHRLRAFTEQLKDDCGADKSGRRPKIASSRGDVERGTILWYDDWRNYGFVRRESGGDLFVHQTEIGALPWHRRTAGTRVVYRVEKNLRSRVPGSMMASDVRLVPVEK